MQMIARFPGKCRECGGKITRGQSIDWARSTGAAHSRCSGKSDQPVGFRPGYSDADMRFDEEQFELNAADAFKAGLR